MKNNFNRLTLFFILGLISVANTRVSEASELDRATEIRKQLGLDRFDPSPTKLKRLRVAVLDNGFGDFQNGDPRLPESTRLISRYEGSNGNPLTSTSHGLYVAQTVWAVTGKRSEGPEFHLLNANGFTHLKAAVKYVVDHQIDIVVYSQNWEFGGNFNGRGFINAQVSKAVEYGALWVNAAGNYGNLVHDSPLRFNAGGWVQFENTLSPESVEFENRFDRNDVKLTLAWSDFTDSEQDHATTDLDVFVYDEKGQVVASGERAQIQAHPEDRREPSQYAREQFSARLARGKYTVRVKKIGGSFHDSDRLRLTFLGGTADGGINLLDHTPEAEIMIPADHPQVFTVGDLSSRSASGPTRDGRIKPDVLMQLSEVRFTDGFISAGTTYATAYFAGVLAVIKAAHPDVYSGSLRSWIQNMNGQCLQSTSLSTIPESVVSTLERFSGLKRETFQAAISSDGRKTLLMNQDPWTLSPLYDFLLSKCQKEQLEPESFETFIAQSPATRVPVQTYYRVRGVQSPLPEDVGPAGEKRWIELRAIRLSAPVCGRSPVWRTPSPEQLFNWN